MGITVLGDIIAILKHAKEVQGRLTTDRALSQSRKQDHVQVDKEFCASPSSQESSPSFATRETRIIKTANQQCSPPKSVSLGHGACSMKEKGTLKSTKANTRSVPNTTTSSIAKRLGPPAPKPFVKPIKEEPAMSRVDKNNVFSRLGDGIQLKATSSEDSGPQYEQLEQNAPSNGILRKRIADSNKIPPSVTSNEETKKTVISLKPSASDSRLLNLKKPSEKTHEKRVSFGSGKTNICDSVKSQFDREEQPLDKKPADYTNKRKKYLMVTTKKDGTKVKEYLEPDDPRIRQMGVTKKVKVAPGSTTSGPGALLNKDNMSSTNQSLNQSTLSKPKGPLSERLGTGKRGLA